jgi:hypothetical protein
MWNQYHCVVISSRVYRRKVEGSIQIEQLSAVVCSAQRLYFDCEEVRFKVPFFG